MSKFIKVPAEQVASLTGLYGSIPSMLEPVEMEGIFYLPEDVISDPEFEVVKEVLLQFEKIEIE